MVYMEPIDPTRYSSALAGEILACLARKGVSRTALAAEIGMCRQSLRNKLSGRTEFTIGELDAIARVVGLSVSELLYRVEVAA